MDAGIADTINRNVVSLIVGHLDRIDSGLGLSSLTGWPHAPLADHILAAKDTGTMAWLLGLLTAPGVDTAPGFDFDGIPADCDWDNLFSHFRAEILARRDPQTPPVRAAEVPVRDGVGSR